MTNNDNFKLPILMYHEVTDLAVPEKYSIETSTFRSQLEHLSKWGLSGVSINQALNSENKDTEHFVALSFDDGHISNISNALPILTDYDYSATFYVTTGRIGSSPEWLSWNDLEKLHYAGMDVQVHGHTHQFFDDMSDYELSSELENSITLIEKYLGYKPRHMSFPGGRFNQFAIDRSAQCGFHSLATSCPGIASINRKLEYPWLLDRMLINKSTSLSSLEHIVTRDLTFIYTSRISYKLKKCLKNTLGNELYHKLWKLLCQ
jgi:peptidoglycan/xylan/chitin deacetylase (PgdA/CDA1 family)